MDPTDLVDLADERLGGAVLYANDEFFAPKEGLLKAERAVFLPHEYTERGKWMDGWETRRRRSPGHDECLVRLGVPGTVRAVVVDTAFFKGNYPERCALDGCFARSDAGVDELLGAGTEWFPLLPEVALQGDHENVFPLEASPAVSHVRLRIFPDGGVARLRVRGVVLPDFRRLGGVGAVLDVASLEAGGRVLACSDMFFGPKHNLILPGASRSMADGWETRRRRGPGNDWVIVELTGAAELERVEIDTSHFKGNAPGACLLEGLDASAGEPSVAHRIADDHGLWRELLPKTKVHPHTRHVYVEELAPVGPVTHLRLSVFPDGGVARLRAYGRLTRAAQERAGLAALLASTPARLEQQLQACCGARAWVRGMLQAWPPAGAPALYATSEAVFAGLSEADLLEAFAHHPPLGASRAARELSAQAARWSRGEQSGAARSPAEVLEALARVTAEYERRHGFVFLLCATGRSGEEMLRIAEERLGRDRGTELAAAADELRAITRLRLEKLLSP
jgi:allantoicase